MSRPRYRATTTPPKSAYTCDACGRPWRTNGTVVVCDGVEYTIATTATEQCRCCPGRGCGDCASCAGETVLDAPCRGKACGDCAACWGLAYMDGEGDHTNNNDDGHGRLLNEGNPPAAIADTFNPTAAHARFVDDAAWLTASARLDDAAWLTARLVNAGLTLLAEEPPCEWITRNHANGTTSTGPSDQRCRVGLILNNATDLDDAREKLATYLGEWHRNTDSVDAIWSVSSKFATRRDNGLIDLAASFWWRPKADAVAV